MDLEVVKRRPYGLLVSVDGAAPTVWVCAKLRKSVNRRERHCELCKEVLTSGAFTWRTVENALYRAVRVCTTCWERPSAEESNEDDDDEGTTEG